MSDEGLRRKNDVGVVEKAHLRTNQDVYREEHRRIYGEPPKVFCDDCEKRLSYCECEKVESGKDSKEGKPDEHNKKEVDE